MAESGRASQRCERTLTDSGHRQWRIREISNPADSALSLIAANEMCIRRFRHFPQDWASLKDAELLSFIEGPPPRD